MNLPPYTHLFTPQSLAKAEDYIDAVKNISLSPNSVSCKVIGSETYKVKISWDDERFTELHCSCPYDFGGCCKHIGAVLLKLDEQNHVAPIPTQDPEWQQIIRQLPEADLRKFLQQYAAENEHLQNTLSVRYSKPSGSLDLDKYRRITDNLFEAGEGQYGYIDYNGMYEVASLVSDLLDNARSYLQKNDFYSSFSIAAAVAEKCVENVEQVDDSNGELGGLSQDAFEIIDKVFECCKDNQLQSDIFDWLSTQMKNTDYGNYGFDEMEPLYFKCARHPQYIEIANSFLDENIKKYSNHSEWSERYRYNKYLNYKIDLLEYQNKNDEVEKLIDSNLNLKDFRQVRVNEYLKDKNYNKAISLIKEGARISEEESSPGHTHDWNRQLLDIYKNQGMTKELQNLSRQMFLENPGRLEYYKLFKSTVAPEEWSKECLKIIQKLKPQKTNNRWFYYFPNNLAAVYVEEKMWPELFEEVKKANNAAVVQQYSTYLKDEYADELLEIYANAIQKTAQNTGRDVYENIKDYLSDMCKLKNGRTKALHLRDNLLQTYKNRPAMKEILGKLQM